MDNNMVIKGMMKENGIPQWRLARLLCCHENSVQRKLRTPLNDADYQLYRAAVEKLIETRRA